MLMRTRYEPICKTGSYDFRFDDKPGKYDSDGFQYTCRCTRPDCDTKRSTPCKENSQSTKV